MVSSSSRAGTRFAPSSFDSASAFMPAPAERRKVMASQSLKRRVDSLEERVTRLEELPVRMDRLESQIVQLRTEMHDEFSAVRLEVRSGDEETRRSLREEIRNGDEETRRSLREEIRNGDEETRRYMRVLFEDLVDRLKVIGEGKHTEH